MTRSTAPTAPLAAAPTAGHDPRLPAAGPMRPLRYRAANGFGATCGVQVLTLGPGVAGLVLAEPPDCHGPSVTNNVELAATLAAARLGLDPRRTVCLEHYPEHACGRERATWDLVRFDTTSGHGRGVSLAGPDWRPLRLPEHWRALAEAAGDPDAAWAEVGFGPLTYPDELLGRIDGLFPAHVPPGWGAADLL